MNLTWLLVGVVYFAAIAFARRATAIRWRVAALFYVLVLAWLWRPMTGPYVNVPTDVVQLVSPWSAIAPPGLSKFTVSNYEMQDTVFQMTPWAHQVRESWKSLEPPLWNGSSGCGQPLLANMQSQGLSPLRLLALPLPLGYSMTAEAAMKLLIALTFTFLYLRRRYDEVPSVIGAIAFGFGTFTITWLHFPHSTVAVFLPAVLYAIDLIAETATFGRIVFAAFLGPMILFGGHPETTAHIVFFATVYALWVWCGAGLRPAFLRALATACVLATFLSAPLLFPFLESMRKTVRYQDLKARPHSDGTAYSDLHSLVPLFQPRFFGTRPGPAWAQNAVAESISGFAGFLGIAAWFALLARRQWRSFETFLVVAMFLTFAILDDWPIAAPFRHLFALSLNARMRLIFCFLAAAATAALLHHARRERLPLYAALIAGVATLLVLFAKIDFPSEDAKRIALMATVPSVAALLALLFVRRAAFIAGAAVFVELWITAQHWNPVRPVNELYQKTPLIEALLRARGNQPYRMAGITGALFPNTHALFGLEDARVHDAMANARYAHALGQAMSYDPLEYYPKFKEPDAPLLDELNVKWLVTEPGVSLQDSSRYKLIYNGPDGSVYENLRVRPRFTGAPVEIVEAGNDRYELRINAPAESLIKASIAAWPGWRITHNGRALQPRIVDHAFLGFVVPPGSGTLRVRYVPASFWGGVAASLLTVLALAIRAGMRTA